MPVDCDSALGERDGTGFEIEPRDIGRPSLCDEHALRRERAIAPCTANSKACENRLRAFVRDACADVNAFVAKIRRWGIADPGFPLARRRTRQTIVTATAARANI